MTFAPAAVTVKCTAGRKRLFRLICLFIAPCVLLLAESILRLAGLGGYPSIFKRVGPTEHGNLVITDPAGAASYFFANRKRPGFNEQYSFYEPKQPGTIRIITVGESAMKGFPEPRNLAMTAFLRAMLSDAWPNRTVEVLNLGTTAVASFPVLEILTESLEFAPDLVIIHTGHNEFFGTYGIASIGRAGSRPWMLRATRFLYSLALVQALQNVMPGKDSQDNKTLMQLMMGRSYVGPDDWRRQAAARNLEQNVSAMVRRCKARHVPVIVCNQPSNERDLAPLGSDNLSSLTAKQRQDFENYSRSGLAALPVNCTNAAMLLSKALEVLPNHARAHYYLGKALLLAGHRDAALQQFIQARDLDPMPWRAPSLSQQAIMKAAREQGAILCDLENAFRAASPGGAIGWELMDDHVHPTLPGEALWARTLCSVLGSIDGTVHVSAQEFARLARDEDYERRLGENQYDRYGVDHTMRVIFDIPFMRETNPDAFIRFNSLADQIETNQPADIQAAMREWQTAVPHAGGKRPLSGMVARVLMRDGKFAEALPLWQIAQAAVPDYTSWHMEYVYFALACNEKLHGKLDENEREIALEEIKQGRVLMQHGFSEFGLAERYLGRLHQLREEFAQAIPFLLASRKKLNGTDLVAADQALVVSYLKTAQQSKAEELIRSGIAKSGVYATMYEKMLSEFLRYNSRTN